MPRGLEEAKRQYTSLEEARRWCGRCPCLEETRRRCAKSLVYEVSMKEHEQLIRAHAVGGKTRLLL